MKKWSKIGFVAGNPVRLKFEIDFTQLSEKKQNARWCILFFRGISNFRNATRYSFVSFNV